MKSGVIVYVAGDPPRDWEEDKKVAIKGLETQADSIEIITRTTGHFDVLDAWRALVCRGMSHIVCKMGIFDESGNIEITGRELRLCG